MTFPGMYQQTLSHCSHCIEPFSPPKYEVRGFPIARTCHAHLKYQELLFRELSDVSASRVMLCTRSSESASRHPRRPAFRARTGALPSIITAREEALRRLQRPSDYFQLQTIRKSNPNPRYHIVVPNMRQRCRSPLRTCEDRHGPCAEPRLLPGYAPGHPGLCYVRCGSPFTPTVTSNG